MWNILIVLEGHCVPQHPLTVQLTQHEDFSQPVPSLFLLPISPCLQIKISQQENLSSALCAEWICFPCTSDLQGSRCLWPRKAIAGGFSLQSICCQFELPVNKSYFFPGWAGRGFASWTWRGKIILRFLSKPDMRMCWNPAGASSPCFCFNMPHWPLGLARRGPRHDGSFPHHTRPWRCLCVLVGLFYHFCGSHLQGQGKLRPLVKEWVVCRWVESALSLPASHFPQLCQFIPTGPQFWPMKAKCCQKSDLFFAPSFRELGNVWLSNKYIRLETLWYLVGCLTVASVLSVSILGVTHISLFSLIPQHFQWAKSINCITKFGKIWWYDGWYWFITFMWKLT